MISGVQHADLPLECCFYQYSAVDEFQFSVGRYYLPIIIYGWPRIPRGLSKLVAAVHISIFVGIFMQLSPDCTCNKEISQTKPKTISIYFL